MMDDFFEKWKEKYGISVFAKDGIVSEESYEGILFILKDVNNAKPGEDIDLRDSLVTRTDEGRTWYNVARWTTALLDDNEYTNLASKMNSDIQHEQMKRVAVINIKKEAGGPKVSDSMIRKCAEQQKEELLEEIILCNPRLVIVCGAGLKSSVESILGKIILCDDAPKMEVLKTAILGTACVNGTDIPIVIYRHPAVGCSAEKSFADMKRIKEYFGM